MRYMPDSPPPARQKTAGPHPREQRKGSDSASSHTAARSSTHWCATRPADTGSGTLGHSFLADLRRFDDQQDGCGLLPAMAASVRHNLAVALHLWGDEGQAVTLKVYPRDRWVQCNVELTALSEQALARLQFSHAERLTPLGEATAVSSTRGCGPLGPLLWQLATLGPTRELLPEIAGTAMYRLAPAPHIDELPMTSVMNRLLSCLRGPPTTVVAMADAAGCETTQVHRFLNALYLQSALMVTRSFPAGWGATTATTTATSTDSSPHSHART